MMELVPVGKFVSIEMVAPDTGRVIMPDVATGKTYNPSTVLRTRILAVGDGRLMNDGKCIPLKYERGDEVLLAPDTQLIGSTDPESNPNHKIVDSAFIVAKIIGRDQNPLPPLPKIITARPIHA